MNEILYSLVAMMSALCGTFLVLKFSDWSRKNSVLLIGFAAGVMISIAFIHLMPEALKNTSNAIYCVLAGFLTMFFLQHFLFFHPCHEEHCDVHHLGTLSTLGLGMHSFFDGLIVCIGFEASFSIGILTTAAVIFHKICDGITITSILIHTNMDTKKIFKYSLLVALFTPIGAIAGLIFLNYISHELVGSFLGFIAGTFIYLSASDLIPETHKASNKKSGICFFVGIALVALLGHLIH